MWEKETEGLGVRELKIKRETGMGERESGIFESVVTLQIEF